MENLTYISKITSIYNTFSKTEKRVADSVLKRSKEIVNMSIVELSDELKVGRASILRFCRKLGADGYQDFKLKLLIEEYSTSSNIYNDPVRSGNVHSILEEVTRENVATLNTSLLKVSEYAVETASKKIFNADKIVILAKGISRASAIAAQYKFIKFGLDCIVPEDYHFQCFSVSNLSEKSVVIIIDLVGTLGEYIHLIEKAKSKNACIVAMVNYELSQITEYADVVLLTEATESPLKDGELTAMLSQLNILDMLYTLLAKKNGEKHTERIRELRKLILKI